MIVRITFCLGLMIGSWLPAQESSVVPVPTQTKFHQEAGYSLPSEIKIQTPDDTGWTNHLKIFATHVNRICAGRHKIIFVDNDPSAWNINRREKLAPEQYTIRVSTDNVVVAAASLKGLTNATATLLQLIGACESEIPAITIQDAPKVAYRNFMVDMGRNPHSVDILKETIDLLWFYKIDSLQLHLTDDQRFAFPSTAFPKLWDGLITRDEFVELEKYAMARGVTIIPELEVPGHSSILRNRYPEVFGKSGTDLAKSETALRGIQTLLDEMMDVFQSTPYIHVGGDEAYGVPEELQRDLINKLHAYLKRHGRQTLVWEGPRVGQGDNKVNTEVIHINWRTIAYPADQMLKDGYRVVNAAWDPLYIVDHYPRINFTMTSPQHVYETLSLTQFKHVNPGIPTFERPIQVEASPRLIGFCMPWWEGREGNYLQQNVPRLIPFSEVAWNPSIQRDYKAFTARTRQTESTRARAFYPVGIQAEKLAIPSDGVFHNQTTIQLSIPEHVSKQSAEIRYTLDGSAPTHSSSLYGGPIGLTKTSTVRAAAFSSETGKRIGHSSRRSFTHVDPVPNLALGKPVYSSVSSGSPFSIQRVTDGGTGSLDFYLGYPATPTPLTLTIDLEAVQRVSRIIVDSYTVSGSYEKYSLEVSVDGKSFTEVASRLERPKKPTQRAEHSFGEQDVRYIRLRSHGNKGYVFDSFSKVIEIQAH